MHYVIFILMFSIHVQHIETAQKMNSEILESVKELVTVRPLTLSIHVHVHVHVHVWATMLKHSYIAICTCTCMGVHVETPCIYMCGHPC